MSCYAALLLISVFSAPARTVATDSVEITVIGTPGANKWIPSIVENKACFISLQDLAKAYSINMFLNPETKKVELKLAKGRVLITAGSPFVVTTNTETKRQSTVQFALPARIIDSVFYVPVNDFLPLFNSIAQAALALASKIDSVRQETQPHIVVNTDTISSYSGELKRNGYLLHIPALRLFKEMDGFIRKSNWYYLTITGAKADTAALNRFPLREPVQEFFAIQHKTALQLAFRLRQKISTTEIHQDSATHEILITLKTITPVPLKRIAAAKKEIVTKDTVKALPAKPTPEKQEPSIAEKPAPAKDTSAALKKSPDKAQKTVSLDQAAEDRRRKAELRAKTEREKTKWKLDVVVLDAGHGGNDPGSLGTIGTREKDITLGIVLKLGKMINERMSDVKTIYTRKTDRFVELSRRGQIANENEGKIFISIHCNSTEEKPSSANGFEIYILRPAKTEDALRIAEKENEVVKLEEDYQARYQEITQENFILLTMAQSAYMRSSEMYSQLLQEEMEKFLHSESRGVKQAGFYVLVGASMPNVLIESGYLSNKKDEKYLRSPQGQQTVAEAIFRALKRYKEEYERSLEEG